MALFIAFLIILFLFAVEPIYPLLRNKHNKVASFKLTIYNSAGTKVEVYKGEGDGWQDYQKLSPQWQINSAIFSLEEGWAHVIQNRLSEYQTEIVGYDTIRKFGEAMQLTYILIAHFSVTYK